ncbi:branched-chain amino acid ABC transporter permease [Polaromonas sp.]|uniref:branched-chain amino acid ABC transporter permease n=1 Tax=Polaromonas sp. TaxID=1869339 RepID=UPI00356A6882
MSAFTASRGIRHGAAWKHCLAIALMAVLAWLMFPDQLPFLSRIAIMAILVLSLDLVVGFGGLATLGHAALYGVGAYAAGILATRYTGDPLAGLMVGALMGAFTAGISGLLLLRYEGFTFLMLTVAVAQIVQNLASKLRDLTGGDDGLSGFSIQRLLGFRFDMQGQTGYVYAVVMLLACYWFARRVTDSPFGLSVQGIHQSRARMRALGTRIPMQLWKLYTFSGLLAGLAGALSAQTNAIVGLDSLGFELSAEILVMLILGGSGRLYGALIGTVIFMVLHHTAASINPYHWLFVIGGMLMLVVLVPREKIVGWRMARRKKAAA